MRCLRLALDNVSALNPIVLENVLEALIIGGEREIANEKGGLGRFTSRSSSINSRRSLYLLARSSLLDGLGLGLGGLLNGRSILHGSIFSSLLSICLLSQLEGKEKQRHLVRRAVESQRTINAQ
jgi:hypothetical protein